MLLLDEPTAGLDPGEIQETREVIRAFGANHAVLLSTHILAEATLICRRVAIINHGRLLAIDSPSGLQRAMEQTNRVSLRVTGAAPALRDTLLAVDGVRAVDLRAAAGEPGVLTVDCQVDGRDGVEATIARAVAGRPPGSMQTRGLPRGRGGARARAGPGPPGGDRVTARRPAQPARSAADRRAR